MFYALESYYLSSSLAVGIPIYSTVLRPFWGTKQSCYTRDISTMNVVSPDALAVPDSQSQYSDAAFLAGFGFLPLFEEPLGSVKASGGSLPLGGDSDSTQLLGADFGTSLTNIKFQFH